MTEPQLEPAVAENYRALVASGDRTWPDVAALADRENAPLLAAYARAQTTAQASERPSRPRTGPVPTQRTEQAADAGR